MTRGQIIVYTPQGMYTTSEFNGDMYPEGIGKDALDCLEGCINLATYKDACEKFNKEHYNYEDFEIREVSKSLYEEGEKISTCSFATGYIDNWFSDYLYIKNLHRKPIKFIDAGKNTVILGTGEKAVFCNGYRLSKIY